MHQGMLADENPHVGLVLERAEPLPSRRTSATSAIVGIGAIAHSRTTEFPVSLLPG